MKDRWKREEEGQIKYEGERKREEEEGKENLAQLFTYRDSALIVRLQTERGRKEEEEDKNMIIYTKETERITMHSE